MRTSAAILAVLCALPVSAVAFDDCDGDPGYVLTIPPTAPIGDIIFGALETPTPAVSLLFISDGNGPADTPYGMLCVDFPPLNIYLHTMPDGLANFACGVPCDPELIGDLVYFQFVAFDAGDSSVAGVSNMVEVTLTEGDCGEGFGCTPGFWRQSQHYQYWPSPFTPDTLFSDVFDDAFPGMTLGEVVRLGGGGLRGLGRHAVASLLNAESPEFPFELTTMEVIERFNAAYQGGEYEDQKDEFAFLNDRDCPF